MTSAFSDRLNALDESQQNILKTSAFFVERVRRRPGLMQTLIDEWSLAVEHLPQKVALLFLANDIIQSSKSDSVKASFQGPLSRAFTVAASHPSNLPDISRVISVWEERRVYPRIVIEQFKKACEKGVPKALAADQASISHVIDLAKTLKRFEETKQKRNGSESEVECEVQEARGKLVRKLVQMLRRMNHAHVDDCIYLQRINTAIEQTRY
jgi:hypothetical protein